MKSKLCTLLLIIFSVFVWITAAQATPAFLITTTDNPINITPGGTATITYTVQNTSGIDMPQMKYFPPALTTITGGTCSNSLAKNASCTVILLLTIPATTPIGTLKLGALGVCGFNGRICSVPYQRVTVNVIPVAIELVSIAITPTSATIAVGSTQQYTAIGHFSDGSTQNITSSVTWHSSNTAAATITPGPGGGLATGVAPGTTMITATQGLITSNSATLTVTSAPSFAYVSNFGSNIVSFCPILGDGSFGTCNTTGSGFNGPFGITINSTGTFGYVVNINTDLVSFCAIQGDGSFGTCNTTGSGFNSPTGIALNPANSFAYVPDLTAASVSFCVVNGDGSFGTCAGTGTGFSNPEGVVINSTNTFGYVTNNGNDTVSFCAINGDGSFGACNTTGNGFSAPSGIAIATISGTTYVYVVNSNSTVSFCPTNPDGSLGTCNTTGSGFNLAAAIAISSTNVAYVTNRGNNTVSFCPVQNDGSFGTCNTTGSGFNNSFGIVVH